MKDLNEDEDKSMLMLAICVAIVLVALAGVVFIVPTVCLLAAICLAGGTD